VGFSLRALGSTGRGKLLIITGSWVAPAARSAMQVKLLKTDNPNPSAVFPGHHRLVQEPGQTTVAEAQAAVDAMGLGLRITEPRPGQVHNFTR